MKLDYTENVVYIKAKLEEEMSKLDEKDLFPFFIFFDICMFFYYILFAPSLFKKPEPHWK